ncbi:MAG: branched-chain amino acid ABC transporter permease [Acidimicrobiales bacterium]|nr:branched-chain amino acid ABC transporter permease [Acidimicrobiales bacterium]
MAGAEVRTEAASPAAKFNWPRLVAGIAVLVVAAIIPYSINDQPLNIVSQVLYLAIAAMGLNLLTGFNGQVSIGHGAFYGVGAFTSAILVVNHGWTFEMTIPVAAVTAAVLGALVAFPALRVKGLYLALITLGLAVLFPVVTKKFVKGSGGVALLQPDRKQVSSMFPDMLADEQYRYFVCLAVLLLLILLTYNLMRSRVGRAIIAVRDQEVAASTVGIDVARVKVLTFMVSAAYAGVAGALSVMVLRIADATNPLVYFQLSIEFLIAMVIGGSATISGPVIGAIFLVIIRRQTDEGTDFLPKLLGVADRTEQLAPALLGITLILITYVLPEGLVGGFRKLKSRFVQRAGQPGAKVSTEHSST